MISKERLAAIDATVDAEGVAGLSPTTVFELVEEVRHQNGQIEYQAGLAREQGDRIRGLQYELQSAERRSEAFEAQVLDLTIRIEELEEDENTVSQEAIVPALMRDAYWRRVEEHASRLWAHPNGAPMLDAIQSARVFVDELDRQRAAEG